VPPGPPRKYRQLDDPAWLAARYAAGATQAEIALEVGCSMMAVSRAMARHKIPVEARHRRRKPLYPQLADPAWLAARYAAGATQEQIAREVGCSQITVSEAMAGHKIAVRPPAALYPQLDDRDWLAAQTAGGRSQRSIATEVGCSQKAVSQALARHGVRANPAGRPSGTTVVAGRLQSLRSPAAALP